MAEFNRLCRESVLAYVDDWNRMTERIGFWLDLDDAYYTITNDYIESVWWILRQFWDKELLYQGYKVVPYCPRCGTALSTHEVAQGYQEVTDPSVFVRFPLSAAAAAKLATLGAAAGGEATGGEAAPAAGERAVSSPPTSRPLGEPGRLDHHALDAHLQRAPPSIPTSSTPWSRAAASTSSWPPIWSSGARREGRRRAPSPARELVGLELPAALPLRRRPTSRPGWWSPPTT